ncbi:MAG: hypothetical protein ACREU2_02455 [Steroidobacteraceae bacterium]
MCYIILLYAVSMASADMPHAAWVGGPYPAQTCKTPTSLSSIPLPRLAPLQMVSRSYGDAAPVKALLDQLGCTPLNEHQPKATLGGAYTCIPPIK